MVCPAVPMIGKTFGRLTVTAEHVGSRSDKSREKRYLARCQCGNETSVLGSNLRKGSTVSCGCYVKELTSNRSKKHGMRGTPEYFAWSAMIRRCHSPGAAAFKNYGGRGIFVCTEWRNSFSQFYSDVGPRPSPEHSLDRINVNKGYYPANCRWTTPNVQARNVRPRNKTGVSGLMLMPSGSYRSSITFDGKTKHLGTFDNLFDAVAARRAAENRYWTDSSETANQ